MSRSTQTTVQLDIELIKKLDIFASRAGISRSQLIRQAIDMYLAEDEEAKIDRALIDAYTRMPQAGEFDRDEWGDMGGMATAPTEHSLRHLEQEERAAGFEPW